MKPCVKRIKNNKEI